MVLLVFDGMKGPTVVLLLRAITPCATVMFEAESICDIAALLVFLELTAAELVSPSSAMIGIGRLLPLRFFVMPLVCDIVRKGRLVSSCGRKGSCSEKAIVLASILLCTSWRTPMIAEWILGQLGEVAKGCLAARSSEANWGG